MRLFTRALCSLSVALLSLSPILAQAAEPSSSINVEFVTNDGGSLVPQSFAYNASPCPAISTDVTDVSIDSDGLARVTVSGTVDDAVSDVVSDPSLQVQSISLAVEGQHPTTVSLSNIASPVLPWRPYAFEARFSLTTLVDVRPAAFWPPPAVGANRLLLETSPNAAGCRGLAFVDLSVQDSAVLANAGQSTIGTFKPTLLRLGSSSLGPPPPDTTVFAFGSLWNVLQFDFGDGPHWYAVDAQANPVVFVPAAGAPPNGNVQELAGDFLAAVFVGGLKVGGGQKPTEHGLIVWQNDVTKLLQAHLKNFKSKQYNEQKGGQQQTANVYQAGDGFDHTDDGVVAEILWREVRPPVLAYVFNSGDELNTDIAYRNGVVMSTDDVNFNFGGSSYNKDFWQFFYRVKDKGADTSACEAIADMFGRKCDGSESGNSSKYNMGCYPAAQYLVMRGASIALGKPRIDAILATHIDLTWIALNGSRDLGENSTADWLPGDWGYIANADPILDPDFNNAKQKEDSLKWKVMHPNWRLWLGENIIYLGGSFDTDPKTFAANAMFWGHINRVPKRTLNKWIDGVNNFPTPNPKAELLSTRQSLRLPPLNTQLKTDTNLDTNAYAGGTITIDKIDYEVVANSGKDIFIRTPPLVHFGVKPKGGGATVTGNMYGYFLFLDSPYMKVTDILMRADEFEDGTLTIAGKDYTVVTNTTTDAGAAVVSLKKDAGLAIPFVIKKGDKQANGNVFFVDLE